MKMKSFIPLISIFLLLGLSGYSQDSIRTKNNKPGTPQSLRTGDNTPQTHVEIINKNSTSNQTNIHRPSESNSINNSNHETITVDPNTAGRPNPTNPISITTTPPDSMRTTTNSSAIQNGISNASKPIRNK
jgi:hypothetical protein